jgi:UDP-3-O-acyl-N-acetylglucosamine deacetylase
MNRFPRKTLKEAVRFEGPGLHSGGPVVATVHPRDQGIAFRRGAQRWPATTEHARPGDQCTKVGEVAVVEHLMSAFAALGLTDAEVEVEGDQLPAMNGCSLQYCQAIVAAGLEVIGEAHVQGPFERLFHIEGDVEIAVSRGTGCWRYEYETGERWPHSQHFEFSFDLPYIEHVAPARTFAHVEHYEKAKQLGLGLGLHEGDGVLIGEDGYETDVRFADEPARHKLLDLIGDLYLSGVPPQFLNVVAQRSGHSTNIAAARKISERVVLD